MSTCNSGLFVCYVEYHGPLIGIIVSRSFCSASPAYFVLLYTINLCCVELHCC